MAVERKQQRQHKNKLCAETANWRKKIFVNRFKFLHFFLCFVVDIIHIFMILFIVVWMVWAWHLSWCVLPNETNRTHQFGDISYTNIRIHDATHAIGICLNLVITAAAAAAVVSLWLGALYWWWWSCKRVKKPSKSIISFYGCWMDRWNCVGFFLLLTINRLGAIIQMLVNWWSNQFLIYAQHIVSEWLSSQLLLPFRVSVMQSLVIVSQSVRRDRSESEQKNGFLCSF